MALNIRRRTAGIVVGAAVLTAGLSGCATDGNVVAKVGDETITQQEFTKALETAYADPIVGKQVKELGSSYRTSYLNDMVSYEIAKEVAADAGVSITDSDIDAKLEELLNGQSIEQAQFQSASQGDPVTAEQLRMRVARSLVNARFGEKVTGTTQEQLAAQKLAQLKSDRDANPASYTKYDLTLTVTQDQLLAQDWIAKANGGMSLQQAVDSNPDPATAGSGATVTQESYTGADLAQQPDVLSQLQAIPVGTTGAVTQGPDQTGAFTYVVVTMNSAALSTDADLEEQATQAADQQFLQAGMTESAKQAAKIDVEVNPRYGSLETPQEGLPSVSTPNPKTFSEPKAPTTAQTPTLPTGS